MGNGGDKHGLPRIPRERQGSELDLIEQHCASAVGVPRNLSRIPACTQPCAIPDPTHCPWRFLNELAHCDYFRTVLGDADDRKADIFRRASQTYPSKSQSLATTRIQSAPYPTPKTLDIDTRLLQIRKLSTPARRCTRTATMSIREEIYESLPCTLFPSRSSSSNFKSPLTLSRHRPRTNRSRICRRRSPNIRLPPRIPAPSPLPPRLEPPLLLPRHNLPPRHPREAHRNRHLPLQAPNIPRPLLLTRRDVIRPPPSLHLLRTSLHPRPKPQPPLHPRQKRVANPQLPTREHTVGPGARAGGAKGGS